MKFICPSRLPSHDSRLKTMSKCKQTEAISGMRRMKKKQTKATRAHRNERNNCTISNIVTGEQNEHEVVTEVTRQTIRWKALRMVRRTVEYFDLFAVS